MMRPMPEWLKNLTASFGFVSAAISAPYEVHKVEQAPIYLPDKVVHDHGRTYQISPSVWSEETLSFSAGMPQKIRARKGDTIKTISERYAVPTRTIIEVNQLSAPFSLKEGQLLTLYGPRIHIVRTGEDVYQIAAKHNVGLSAVARQNKMRAPFKVLPGQALILPASPVKLSGPRAVPSEPTDRSHKMLEANLKQLSRNRNLTFKRPLRGVILSGFGPKERGLYNDGINIRGRLGDTVRAAESGVVVYSGHGVKSYGNLILIKHKDGWITAYAHLSQFKTKKGDLVKVGQAIAAVGRTGYVQEPQLHFEIRHNGKPVNPIDFF